MVTKLMMKTKVKMAQIAVSLLFFALCGLSTLSAQAPQVGDMDYGGVVVSYNPKTDNVLVMSLVEEIDTRWEEARGWARGLGLGTQYNWRLPEIKELALIYENQEIIDAALSVSGYSGLSDHYYWGSSEYETYRAWYVKVGVASSTSKSKTSKFSARAVRSFNLGSINNAVAEEDDDSPLLRLHRR